MTSRVVRIAVRVGLVAAAGTAGVLCGFDARAGLPGRSFFALGRSVVASAGYGIAGLAAIVVGLVVHLCTIALLAAPFAALAPRWRGTRLLLGALVYAAGIGGVVVRALPPVLRPGDAAGASGAQVVVLYVVFAVAVAVGTRIARSFDQPVVPAEPGGLQRPPTSDAREGGTGE